MATMQCRRTSRHLRPSGSMSPESGGARFDGAVKRTARRGHGSRSWLTTSFPNPHPSSLAKRALCRQTPKVGAVCGKAARTDLCGGRAVMDVPTAILRNRLVVVTGDLGHAWFQENLPISAKQGKGWIDDVLRLT